LSTVRATPRRGGPFLVPARTLLLVFGIIGVGLGIFTLLHEYHSHEVDALYTIVGVVVAIIWLVSLALAFMGFRLGVFVAAAVAFIDFGVTATSHFEAGAASLGTFVKSEGLPVATVAMALLSACVLTVVSATVAWGTPRGRDRRLDTLPLLVVAGVGAILVILQATDGVHRDSFGTSNTEDGAFAAAVTASLWLLGGLWIARVRRVGAMLIALATFIVWYSFVTLHLLKGGVTLTEIAAKSGVAWAVFSASAAILAAASFLVALGLFILTVWPLPRSKSATAAPAGRRASG
jgi:hypothetical protein